jgi:peptide/nickel transport system substrate-binding protein
MRAQRWLAILAVAGLLGTAMPAAAAPASQGAGESRSTDLRIAIPGRVNDPTNLNIYSPSVSRSDTGLHQVVYEYLFYNNLQTGEFIPWLGESFQYNDDFTALTVKLREGVTWSDGQPFTPDDVVFTYQLLRANPVMVWAEEANKRVASVTAVDANTVQFNLTEANPRFHLNREAFPAVGIWGGITILPRHVWQGQNPLEFKSNPPIGTGPYKLRAATPTAITWERRDDWWGSRVFGVSPAPQTVTFTYLGPETNVALALASNDLDSPNIGILSLGSLLSVAQQNPNISAWSNQAPYAWLDPCPRGLMIQNARAPLDNRDVRWAISYALDRNAISALAYDGATVPSWGIWPYYDGNTAFFEAASDVRAQYPSDAFDPEQAIARLNAAGVNPSDITLKYHVNGSSNEEMKVAQVLADQLRAIGFNVNIQPLSGAVEQDTRRRGDYDIALQAFCPGYIAENLELFHSKFYVPLGEPAPWYERNSFRYANPELDAIVDQMFTVQPSDIGTMQALYRDALAIWLRDLPVVPVTQAPALVPFNSTYWQGWPSADNPWNMPVSWWATFNLVLNGYPNAQGGWVPGIRPSGR